MHECIVVLGSITKLHALHSPKLIVQISVSMPMQLMLHSTESAVIFHGDIVLQCVTERGCVVTH